MRAKSLTQMAAHRTMKLSFCKGTATNDECIFFCRDSDNRRVNLRVKNVWFTSTIVIRSSVDNPGSPYVNYEKFPKWQGDKEHADGEPMVTWYPVTKSHPQHDSLVGALRQEGFHPSHCFTQFTGYGLAMVEDVSYTPHDSATDTPRVPEHNVLCVRLKDRNRQYLSKKQQEIKSLVRSRGADTIVADRKVTYYSKLLEANGLNIISTIEVEDFEVMSRSNRISTDLKAYEIQVEDFSSIRLLHEGWMAESPEYRYIGPDKAGNPVEKKTNIQMPICYFDFEQEGIYVTNISELNSLWDNVMMCSFGMLGRPSTVVMMGDAPEVPEGVDRVISVPYGDRHAFWTEIRNTLIYYDADVYMAWNGNGYDFIVLTIHLVSVLIPGYDEHRIRGLFTADFLMTEGGKQLVSEAFAPFSVISVPEEGAYIERLYGKTSAFLENPFTLHVSGRDFVDAMIGAMVVWPYQPSYSLKEAALSRKVKEKEGPSYVELGRAFASMWYWDKISKCTHRNKVCCGGGTQHIDETGTYMTECECSSSDALGTEGEDVPQAPEIEEFEALDEVIDEDAGEEQVADVPVLEDKVTKVAKLRTLRVPCTKACQYCQFAANKAHMDITFSQMSEIQIYAVLNMRAKDHDLYDQETALSFWKKSVRYVMNDTEVMIAIALSLSMSQGLIAMCNTNRTTLMKIVAGQTARFVNLFYWQAVRGGLHYIDNQLKKNSKMYGGQVTPPIIGIHEAVSDLDANSLYPSVTMEKNTDSATHVHDAVLESFIDKFPPSMKVSNTFQFTVVDDFPSTESLPDDDGIVVAQAATRRVSGITFKGPNGYLDVRLNPELRITTNNREIKAFNFRQVESRVDQHEVLRRMKENPDDPFVKDALEDILRQGEEIVQTYQSSDACTTPEQEFYADVFRNNARDCPDYDKRLTTYSEKKILPRYQEKWISEIRVDNQKRVGKTIPGEPKKVRWYLYVGRHRINPGQHEKATFISVYKVYYSQVAFSPTEKIRLSTWSTYLMPVTSFEPHAISFRSYTYVSHLQGMAPVISKRLLDARAKVRKVDMVSPEALANPQLMTDLDAKQKAFKETANSMYGATGTNGEHYSEANQSTITGMGRFFIQEAIMLQTLYGAICVYSDTDSDLTVFIVRLLIELVGAFGKLLQNKVNGALTLKYRYLRVGSDGFFERLITTNPKKYVMLHDGKVDVKGLMIKKRDQIKWAQITAQTAYDMRIRGADDEDVMEYVRSRVALIDQIVITENGVSGPVPIEHMCKRVFLTDETKSTPQVQVAEKLGAAGFKVARGDMIDFFRMKDGFYGSPLIPDNVRNIDLDWVKATIDADILGLKRAMKYLDPPAAEPENE